VLDLYLHPHTSTQRGTQFIKQRDSLTVYLSEHSELQRHVFCDSTSIGPFKCVLQLTEENPGD
jgi:hypothetical protein